MKKRDFRMDKKKKWKIYEARWKFRDFYFRKVLQRHIFEKYFHYDLCMPRFAHKWIMSAKSANEWLYEKILSGEPFMAARFGNTELSVITTVLKNRICGRSKENDERFDKWFPRLGEGAGFFPVADELADAFTDLMLNACKSVDLLGMWHCHMEDYVIEEYLPQADLTFLFRLEPWRCNNPWSRALKGKRVLVIHPFEKSIRKQYQKRELLFPGTEVLPEFELLTLKAVQTVAGERDERFETWFDALDYMYQEALKKDFDIAIIGCGAYGFPLAAKLKEAGKQAIHLGGVTQIMFGIKGKRWVECPTYRVAFNEAWEYPLESETPRNSQRVEESCYWK